MKYAITELKVKADYREVRSTIPEILREKGAHVELSSLKAGDYIVNDEIIFERKSKEDFVLSILQNRLFAQCSRMKKTGMPTVLLIEGNPYQTQHDISRQAIKGALISVAVAWQLPIVYARDCYDSAEILLMAGNQMLPDRFHYLARGSKPRRLQTKALYFLQGLPMVGPATAKALINKFCTLENIVLATEDELCEVEGVGKNKAKTIRKFLASNYQKQTRE